MNSHTRLPLPDLVRGITLVSMIVYHGLYDLNYIYGVSMPWYRGTPGYLWQQSICWTFILLSGMCFLLGHHPVKRGLLLTVCGLVITLVTALFMPESIVIMGVLNFYGLAMLLTALLRPLLLRIPAVCGLASCAFLFFLTREIPSGYLGFESLRLFALPRSLYQNPLTMLLGFPYPGFYSTDYFSLFPWFFLFLTGFFLWRFLEKSGFLPSAEAAAARKHLCRPLEWTGKNTLPIYMLHQPALMAVFTLASLLGLL